MGRGSKQRHLQIALNGDAVGRLDHRGAVLRFQYDADWLLSRRATPISLSMPLSTEPYEGDLVSNYLDNLLPDNDEIRRRMQQTLGADSTRPFDLLEVAGADCVGALQFLEAGVSPDVHRVDAVPVSSEEIEDTLNNLPTHPLGMTRERDFRISVAGAQYKTAFLWHDDQWKRPCGATPTSHIFKLPIGKTYANVDMSDSVENEWLCLRLARGLGLSVPNAEIQLFGDASALVVERFDRQWAEDGTWLIRLPLEDTCQSLGIAPARKYESDSGPGVVQVMSLLEQSSDSHADRTNFMRALISYWLLAAVDGHAKNFSVFLYPQGRMRLAPVYDILSIYPAMREKSGPSEYEIKMAMAAVGKNRHYKWRKIQRRHWISTARACRLPAETITSLIDDLVDRVHLTIETAIAELSADFPGRVSEPIFEGLAKAAEKLRE